MNRMRKEQKRGLVLFLNDPLEMQVKVWFHNTGES